MIKKYGRFITLLLTVTLLSSCASYYEHQRISKLESRKKLCTNIRHQVIFNTARPPNMQKNTPTTNARLLKEYQRYDCDQFNGNTSI